MLLCHSSCRLGGDTLTAPLILWMLEVSMLETKETKQPNGFPLKNEKQQKGVLVSASYLKANIHPRRLNYIERVREKPPSQSIIAPPTSSNYTHFN